MLRSRPLSSRGIIAACNPSETERSPAPVGGLHHGYGEDGDQIINAQLAEIGNHINTWSATENLTITNTFSSAAHSRTESRTKTWQISCSKEQFGRLSNYLRDSTPPFISIYSSYNSLNRIGSIRCSPAHGPMKSKLLALQSPYCSALTVVVFVILFLVTFSL